MSDQSTVGPCEALDRIFAVVREEASANPKFARRLLEAAGVTVKFAGGEALAAVDPVVLASRVEYADFRETFSTFTDAQLKGMIKTYALGTAEEVKAAAKKKRLGLIDLIWHGSKRYLLERGG
jgi:hypothetical protein